MSDPTERPIPDPQTLQQLDQLLQTRKNAAPEDSYAASLFHKGLNKILEKVGEEAIEMIIAGKELEQTAVEAKHASADKARAHFIYETADLWFHSLIALSHFSITSQDVLSELQRRLGTSGHVEKAARKDGKDH